MRVIIVRFNDHIQAVTAVNDSILGETLDTLREQAENAEEGWTVKDYAVDPASVVVEHCIPNDPHTF